MNPVTKPNDPNAQQAPEPEDSKSIKKLIESYVSVYALQNGGKEPSRHEIAEFLKSDGEQGHITEDRPTGTQPQEPTSATDPDVPGILNFLAYYGKDPESPMYYGHDDSGIYFNVANDSHEAQRPSILDSLPSRPVQQGDLVPMLTSGLMTDLDYHALKGRGLIHKDCERAHELMMKMRSKVQELQTAANGLGKSLPGTPSNPDEAERMKEDKAPKETITEDRIDSASYRSGESSEPDTEPVIVDDEALEGFTNVAQEMVRHALARELPAAIKSYIDQQIAQAMGGAQEAPAPQGQDMNESQDPNPAVSESPMVRPNRPGEQ